MDISALTPEQQAEYIASGGFRLTPEQLAAAQPAGIDALRDFTPEQLVSAQVQDPDNFDMVAALRARPNFQRDPKTVNNVANAFNLLKQRGILQDLPGPSRIAHTLYDAARGFGKQVWNYVSALDAVGRVAVPGLTPEQRAEIQRGAQQRVAENISGSELAVRGVGHLAAGIGKFIGRKTGITKDFQHYTDSEKLADLWDAIERGETEQRVASGHGTVLELTGPEVVKELEATGHAVRPEESSILALGDPVSWYTMGRGFGLVGKALPALPLGELAQASAKAVGATVTGAGRVAQGTAKVVEKAAPLTGAAVGAVKGSAFAPGVGTFGGLFAGYKAGEVVSTYARKAGKQAAKVAGLGRQISGKTPITSGVAQFGRDIAESIPGVGAGLLGGAAFDLGIAATAETPQEKQSLGFGVGLAGLHGLKRTGIHVLGGQLTAPFAWSAANNASRVAAVSGFVQGLGKRLVYEPDQTKLAGKIEAELTAAGIDPATAKTTAAKWSEQLGVFSVESLPDVVFAKDLSAAPHESFHAVQAVLGEPANLVLDQFIKQNTAPELFSALTESYAQRLAESAGEKYTPGTAAETILRLTNWGAQAEQTAGRKLTPEESQALVDRYITREIAAENFDALFKHGVADNAISQKLARVIARLIELTGGNPVAGRTSEIGGVPLDYGTMRGTKADAEAALISAREGQPLAFGTEIPVEPAIPAPKPAAASEVVPKPPGAPAIPTIPPVPPADKKGVDKVEAWLTTNPQTPERETIARAVAQSVDERRPLNILYKSARGDAKTRPGRRGQIEAARNDPNVEREDRHELLYFYKFEFPKTGDPQLDGWSVNRFNENTEKLTEWAKQTKNQTIIDYLQSPDFQADVATFAQNQSNGYTGSGKPLAVPPAVVARGFTEPPKTGEPAIPLDQSRADIINTLFHVQIPKGVSRVAPLHLAGQEIAEATSKLNVIDRFPGVEPPVPARPRGEYTPEQLAEAGIVEPRGVREVNPFRQWLEQESINKKTAPPSFIDVRQHLNFSRIESIGPGVREPAARVGGANVLTLAAGFQPKSSAEQTAKVDELLTKKLLISRPRYAPGLHATGPYWMAPDGTLFYAERYHEPWAMENITVGIPIVATMIARQKGWRQVWYNQNGFYVEGGSLSREQRAELEDLAFEKKIPVLNRANDRLLIDSTAKFLPESGEELSAQFQPKPGFQPKAAADVERVANEYAKSAGIAYRPPARNINPPEDLARRVADWYDAATTAPESPEVRAAYDPFIAETLAQFDEITRAGYTIEPWTGQGEPYRSSAEMVADVAERKHLYFLPTGEQMEGTNLLKIDAGTEINGHKLSVNDVFRAVHDFFGHARTGNQFGPRGEFNAWREHSALYTEPAQPALAAETLAQNSWVNFGKQLRTGPEGEPGYVPLPERPFAVQKNVTVPEDLLSEARAQFSPRREKLIHYSEREGLKTLSPKFHGTGIPGAESSRRRDYPKEYLPRVYFGTKGYEKEPNLGDKIYFARVDKSKLYDFQADPENLYPTQSELESAGFAPFDQRAAVTLYEARIKSAGYSGYKNTSANAVAMFEDVPVVSSKSAQFSPRRREDTGTMELFAGFEASPKLTTVPHVVDIIIIPDRLKAVFGNVRKSREGSRRFIFWPATQERPTEPQSLTRLADWRTRNPNVILSDPIGSNQWRNSLGNEVILLRDAALNSGIDPEAVRLSKNIRDQLSQDGLSEAEQNQLLAGTPEADLLREYYQKTNTYSLKAAQYEEAANATDELLANQRLSAFGLDDTIVGISDQLIEAAKRKGDPDIIDPENAAKLLPVLEKEFPELVDIVRRLESPSDQRLRDFAHEKLREYLSGDEATAALRSPTEWLEAERERIPQELRDFVEQRIFPNADWSPEGEDLRAQFAPGKHDQSLPGFDEPERLSTKQLSEMSVRELADYYPETVIPRKPDEKIESNIVDSPLAKSSDKPVDAFAERLVDFAKQYKDNPVYQSGLRWYSEFVPMLRREFGEHAEIFAELLAATSPRTPPSTNFGFALDAFEGFRAGRYDKLIDKFNEGLTRIADGTWESWLKRYGRDLPANISPATYLAQYIVKNNLLPRQSNGKLFGSHSTAVLQVFARQWLAQNKGLKTLNFVENLLGKSNEATIDVWANRTMRRLGYSGLQDRWRILPQNEAGVTDADFKFSQSAFREAAKRLGIKPDALQGGLWFAEKELWANNGWGRLDLGDFRAEMKKLPLLRAGIQQRLTTTRQAARVKPMQQAQFSPGKILEPGIYVAEGRNFPTRILTVKTEESRDTVLNRYLRAGGTNMRGKSGNFIGRSTTIQGPFDSESDAQAYIARYEPWTTKKKQPVIEPREKADQSRAY